MIQQVDSIILIPQILRLAKSMPDIKEKVLEKLLIEGIKDPETRILIEKKDTNIRGFAYASIEVFRGEEAVFIQACYIDPGQPNIGFELLTRLRQWAKERNIKNLIMITRRNTKAWRKKYKFKLTSYVMTKEA